MINTDVTYRGEDVDVIDGEVAVILADQVIQDKRILELEMDSDGISNIFQHSLLENNISFLKCLILVINDVCFICRPPRVCHFTTSCC